MTAHEAIFEDVLEGLSERDLLRKIKTIDRVQGNRAYFQGKQVTLFCTNDYLGLSKNAEVIEAFKSAADTYGVGSGAARLIAGSTELHDRLERELADLKQKEACVLFSAGYLANVGALSALAGKGDLIVMDKLCHASLIDGARLSGADIRVFPHKNYEKCAALLSGMKPYKRKVLVTDAVFSMDGDLANLKKLAEIKKTSDCLWVVDDAHGTGVLGPHGEGACIDPKINQAVDVITGTLSKSLGCLGGFAVSSELIKNYLINHARSFIFATSLPPAVCAAAIKSIQLIRTNSSLLQSLHERRKQMIEGLRELEFNLSLTDTPIIPIIIGSEKLALKISESLFDQGFWVPAIRYPTVAKSQARLRVTVNAAHTQEEVNAFLSAMALIKRGIQTDTI